MAKVSRQGRPGAARAQPWLWYWYGQYYYYLYHAIENTANQNVRHLLYMHICQYSS